MHPEPRIHRLAAPLAAVAALGYCIEGAIVVRSPQPEHGWHAAAYAVEAAFIVALLASLPLVGLLGAGASRLATRVIRGGFAAMLVSAVASLAAGGEALGPAFFLGLLAALGGLAGLTVAALRRRAPGWWTAPMVAVGLVLSIALGDQGGGILFGLAWAAVAVGVRADAPALAPA
jgi:hypothetical protein